MEETQLLTELTELKNILKDIQNWIKIIGWSKAKEALEVNMKEDLDRLIYHYSDGEHGIRDIIAVVSDYGLSTSYGGIHGRWQRWAQNGILLPLQVRAGVRYVKRFNLDEFGFEVPEKLND